jgi:hypothetical protein
VLGRHGTPIQVQVLRLAEGAGMRRSCGQADFKRQIQPLTYVLYRGVNAAQAPAGASTAMGNRTSISMRTPSPFRHSPSTVADAVALKQRPFGVNEHMCGIGVFIERVCGSLVVKSINPNGPAGQVPPTYLFPGRIPTLRSAPVYLKTAQFSQNSILAAVVRCVVMQCRALTNN